jgi:hypothetical protein
MVWSKAEFDLLEMQGLSIKKGYKSIQDCDYRSKKSFKIVLYAIIKVSIV